MVMKRLQALRGWSTQNKILLIISPLILGIIYTSFLPPEEQPESYHHFADQRQLIPFIPNTFDVISNIPFLIVGLMGIDQLKRMKITRWERMTWSICFYAMIATFLGSSYYHLNPNSYSLLWDRLPMSLIFAPLISITIYEGINREKGEHSLMPSILLSIGSVFHWYLSNDLRYYALAQLAALYLLAIIPLLFPYSKSIEKAKSNEVKERIEVNRIRYYGSVVLFYIIAKICESLDLVIFTLDFHSISGHTLKHIFSALGGFMFISYLRHRRLYS